MITKQQWQNINFEMLGLRSEDNPTTIKGTGASYAMDMGIGYTFGSSAPVSWGSLLTGTIKYMQLFENYESRFLMIVANSTGSSSSSEYSNCFPKCSSAAREVKAAISLNNTVEILAEWVEESILNMTCRSVAP